MSTSGRFAHDDFIIVIKTGEKGTVKEFAKRTTVMSTKCSSEKLKAQRLTCQKRD
jgi:hypothetical protein